MDKPIVPELSNSNPSEVVEIEDDDTSIGIVEKQKEDSKHDHQFNEKYVPQIFRTFINSRMSDLKEVFLSFNRSACLLKLDDSYIQYQKINDDWTVTYEKINKTIETVDAEKSIINHLWFVLKNPNIKLETFGILDYKNLKAENRQILDLEKLNTLLQSMLSSFDHQIQTNAVNGEGCNEDMFLTMLKHVDSETLDKIFFNLSWKEEGNYRKMKEIVETDQWKKAKLVFSHRVAPSEIDELFQYKSFSLQLDRITPEDVLRVAEHVFNSSPKYCYLLGKHEEYHIDAIIDVLQSQNDGSRIIKVEPTEPELKFAYTIVKSGKRVQLVGDANRILFRNY